MAGKSVEAGFDFREFRDNVIRANSGVVGIKLDVNVSMMFQHVNEDISNGYEECWRERATLFDSRSESDGGVTCIAGVTEGVMKK